MNIENLIVGMEIKNYKALCELLSEPIKGGDSKKAQMKQWEQYFTWHKVGNKFVIDKIKVDYLIPPNNDISVSYTHLTLPTNVNV